MLTGALILSIGACNDQKKEETSDTDANAYDSVLAQKLGADEYGMHKYVIALLKEGPNRNQDSVTAIELQKAHRANIERLTDEGKLVMAGPCYGESELAGLFVFDVETINEAKTLTESDPAIQQGRLVMELHQFYSSAAIVQINEIHDRITR